MDWLATTKQRERYSWHHKKLKVIDDDDDDPHQVPEAKRKYIHSSIHCVNCKPSDRRRGRSQVHFITIGSQIARDLTCLSLHPKPKQQSFHHDSSCRASSSCGVACRAVDDDDRIQGSLCHSEWQRCQPTHCPGQAIPRRSKKWC